MDGEADGGSDIGKSAVQKERVGRTGIAVEGTADVERSQIGGDGGVQGERGDQGAGIVKKPDNAVVVRRVELTDKFADGGAEVVRFHAAGRVLHDIGPIPRRQKRYRNTT